MTDEDDYDESAPLPPAKPAKKTPFGWCLTNQHEKCRVTIGRATCPCACPNHGTEQEQLPGASPNLLAIVEKYGIK